MPRAPGGTRIPYADTWPEGPTIWDAVDARDEAMLRVQAHSAPWAAVAMDAVRAAARRETFLSSESIWKVLDDWGIPRPIELRAVGPVMARAVKEGLIAH